MKPPDPSDDWLLREWIRKADGDLLTVQRLLADANDLTFREIVAFHCQQAAEKYLKALLTRFQIDFPKTHDIEQLLYLAGPVNPTVVESLMPASWLTPFAVQIRYPADLPELPGDPGHTCIPAFTH